jgi:predicted DNA-binding transcriptional regulator AlpA
MRALREVSTSGPLVNAKDVAAFLGMSLRWVHEQTRLDRIPHYHFGRAIRFDLAGVRAWMQHRLQGDGDGIASGGR